MKEQTALTLGEDSVKRALNLDQNAGWHNLISQ